MNTFERGNEVSQMVKVSVEVRSGSARFWVPVQSQSVQQAESTCPSWYPGREVRVKSRSTRGLFGEDSVARMWGDDEPSVRIGAAIYPSGGQLRVVLRRLR